MKKPEGEGAFVTGASNGIGASITKHLSAEGVSVVVNYASSRAGAESAAARAARRDPGAPDNGREVDCLIRHGAGTIGCAHHNVRLRAGRSGICGIRLQTRGSLPAA